MSDPSEGYSANHYAPSQNYLDNKYIFLLVKFVLFCTQRHTISLFYRAFLALITPETYTFLKFFLRKAILEWNILPMGDTQFE